jgi:DNA-binding CsgD family transcriptional regulator
VVISAQRARGRAISERILAENRGLPRCRTGGCLSRESRGGTAPLGRYTSAFLRQPAAIRRAAWILRTLSPAPPEACLCSASPRTLTAPGLGERVERPLGRKAAARATNAGLSRRELEIARLVALGRTGREIAGNLSLSPRTVGMHVHNVLVKLDCRSRVDIARRAAELGLLA